MRYTLLELTQDILSSMDSDEINSISDTPESLQVVKVIKTVYDDIISRGDLQSNKTLFNFTPSNDTSKPVLMYKPDNIDRIEWLRYNTFLQGDTDAAWRDITFIPIEHFIEQMQMGNVTETNMESFEFVTDGFVFTFYYRNDTAPHYYTTFDDNTVIFDSYDKSVDTTLQSSKTLAFGSKKTTFIEEDSFVPSLQPQQFALLLNEAKSLAWAELKQTSHGKAEQTARRNWRHLQKTKENIPSGRFGSNAHPFDQLRNFGRN